jgi:hypothetical protein
LFQLKIKPQRAAKRENGSANEAIKRAEKAQSAFEKPLRLRHNKTFAVIFKVKMI